MAANDDNNLNGENAWYLFITVHYYSFIIGQLMLMENTESTIIKKPATDSRRRL